MLLIEKFDLPLKNILHNFIKKEQNFQKNILKIENNGVNYIIRL